MKRHRNRNALRAGLAIALAAALVGGCQEGQKAQEAQEAQEGQPQTSQPAPDAAAPHPTAAMRAVAPHLSEEQARARSARVGDVDYALEFELDGEAADFSGHVEIRFNLTDADDDLTVDFIDGAVSAVRINDADATARTAYNDYFITLQKADLRVGANVVGIAFTHPYSKTGDGLYRFRDPVDNRDYLYTDFEPYDQNRLFPSFDQPDLKATYATRVTVPADWHVISIVQESGAEELDDGRKLWTFPPSARISTYIYALHAGHYRMWEGPPAGDIPQRLFARHSMAQYVRTDDWFTPTLQGFEFFQKYFDVPYPFGKYDHVIVPHFNAGAMENVGAVTFAERFLSRGAVTLPARRSLASVIMHEMAHMWFGNLVTMDWWNGLWLNETFATYMANEALEDATEFADGGLGAFRRTVGAYRADERDTTHPVEMPTPTTDDAFAIFDAITYGKGSATMNQLRQVVGAEPFRVGVSNYMKKHAYGNTTIDDFMGAIAESSGMDLDVWAAEWLGVPGANSVSVEFSCAGGAVSRMRILQGAPEKYPTLRTHRTQLGLHYFGDDGIRTEALAVTYAGANTDVPEAAGRACPDFVFANHGDWDYAQVHLDRDDLDLLAARINDFPDALTRAMLWNSVYEMVLYGRLAPAEFVDFALANLGGEPHDDNYRQVIGALQGALSYLERLAPDAEATHAAVARAEAYFWDAFLDSEPGSDRQVYLFDNYRAAVSSEAGQARLASLLADADPELPDGFDFDQSRRWAALVTLSGFGHPQTDALLAAERERDASDFGQRRAISVDAARPDAANQRRLAERLLDASDAGPSTAEANAIAGGLFPIGQRAMHLALVDRAFAALPMVSESIPATRLGSVAGGLLGTICDAGYLGKLDAAIAGGADLSPSLRKRLLDMRFNVRRCLAIGEAMQSAPM